MASNGLSINSVVITVIAIAVGLVLIGSLLAPIASDVMTQLTATDSDGAAIYSEGGSWANLVGVVVIVSILGLIIVAVNEYTKKS